jgi:hypothetical protein
LRKPLLNENSVANFGATVPAGFPARLLFEKSKLKKTFHLCLLNIIFEIDAAGNLFFFEKNHLKLKNTKENLAGNFQFPANAIDGFQHIPSVEFNRNFTLLGVWKMECQCKFAGNQHSQMNLL